MKITPRLSLITLFAVSLIGAGCATTKQGSGGFEQPVNVTSYPSGAQVQIGGETVGTTPVTLQLSKAHTHQIVLSKDGYKEQYFYVAPKVGTEEHYVRFGLLQDAGYYNTLTPSPVEARLVPDIIPTSRGADPYAELTRRVLDVDQLRKDGKINQEEHSYIISELIEFYN